MDILVECLSAPGAIENTVNSIDSAASQRSYLRQNKSKSSSTKDNSSFVSSVPIYSEKVIHLMLVHESETQPFH
jgi:hypothetical protein